MNKWLVPMTLMIIGLVSCTYSVPQLVKAFVEEVIAAMTVEEKANMVIGRDMEGFTGNETVIGSTLSLISGVARATYAILCLGIPPLA